MARVVSDILVGATYVMEEVIAASVPEPKAATMPLYIDQLDKNHVLENLEDAAQAVLSAQLPGVDELLEVKRVVVSGHRSDSAMGTAYLGRADDFYFSFPQMPPNVRGSNVRDRALRFIDTSGSVITSGNVVREEGTGAALTVLVPFVRQIIMMRETSAPWRSSLRAVGDGLDKAGKWNSNPFYGFSAGEVLYHGSEPLLYGNTTPADSSRRLAMHIYEARASEFWLEYTVNKDGTVLEIDPRDGNEVELSQFVEVG